MQLKHLRSPVMVVLAAAACSVLLAYVGRETGRLLSDLVPFLDPDHFRQDWRVVPLAPVLAALASVIACVSLASERSHAWGRRAVTRFAVLSSASLLLLCSLALHKRLGHTPIDVFLSDLAAAAHEIPPPGVAHREKLPPHVTHASLALGRDPDPPIFYMSYGPGPDGRRESTIGGLMVFQQCWGDGCSVALALTARDFYAQFPPGFSESAWSSYLPSALHQDWGESIRFARDPTGEVLFLAGHGPRREYHLDQGCWQPTELSSARIAARTSPPSSWVWLGILGLVAAASLLLQRRRIGARRHTLEAARQGTLTDDGRVTFPDGYLSAVDSPADLALGPVLVLGQRSDSAYRQGDPLRREHVSAGTLEEHLARLRFDILRCDAAIAAFTCLTSAPLIGAALAGLVL